MHHDEHIGKERRDYIRLDSVFPVQFHMVSSLQGHFVSEWLQGFTSNVSKGGICLFAHNLSPQLLLRIKEPGAMLVLDINMPPLKKPIRATAKLSWIKAVPDEEGKYLIGLNYSEIDPQLNRKIVGYARMKRLFVPLALGVMIILGLMVAAASLINLRLTRDNQALVTQLRKVARETNAAKFKAEKIIKDKARLQSSIRSLEARIQAANQERKNAEGKAQTEAAMEGKLTRDLNLLIKKLAEEKVALQDKMRLLTRKQDVAAKEIIVLGQKKAVLEKANFDKMYQWLKIHQNPRTGLVMSFEGDGDIANWAFIYDQALAIQAYTYFSDFQNARRALDFFAHNAQRQNGDFLNAYYAQDGTPAEFTVHSGPNIWLGIAVVQYTHRSGDNTYLNLAENIAMNMIKMQEADAGGGIKGGPQVSWYSTEHNLDAYAFFSMLQRVTGKTMYQKAAEKALAWLTQHTYDHSEVPVKRGKGDSTIATDTYAWSISAVGPDKLQELGLDPQAILDFAEKNCSAQVTYIRPEGGAVKIKGFDFSAQKNLARGGIVSSEWTAQMVLAFESMADYFKNKNMPEKAQAYSDKAQGYLENLSSMIISSPSPSGQGQSCLPYATEEFSDTGHGWITPKGKSTGSVAGTAYTLFAYYHYNPLELKE